MSEEIERLSGDRKMKMREILKKSLPYLALEKWAIIGSFLLIVV